MNIAPRQLQAKYKHARDFGISGPYGPATVQAFAAAIRAHVAAPTTPVIAGTFRGTIPVIFYVDPATGLTVMTTPTGDFISGWKLSSQQLQHILSSGRL